jgi:hypothetical protein
VILILSEIVPSADHFAEAGAMTCRRRAGDGAKRFVPFDEEDESLFVGLLRVEGA